MQDALTFCRSLGTSGPCDTPGGAMNAPRLWVSLLLLGTAISSSATDPARGEPVPAARGSVASPDSELTAATLSLRDWVREHRGRLGLSAVNLDDETIVVQQGAETPLNPASNSKLVTAATLLSRLGPGHRFRTTLHGRLNAGAASRLVLYGEGDPSLTSQDLFRMAEGLVNRGLRRVTEGVGVDQSRFDQEFVPPAFQQQPNEWAAFRAPVSAVAVDRNVVALSLVPTEEGQPALVSFSPPGFVLVRGQVTTGKKKSSGRPSFWLEPARNRLLAKLSGELAEASAPWAATRRVDDPRLVPGYVLVHYLKLLGVSVPDTVFLASSQGLAVLSIHRSRELSSLLAELGKESDNFTAEMLLKVLGATVKGQGSSVTGMQVVREYLEGLGPLEPGTRLVNGSGLFDANRLSAALLIRVLKNAHADPRLSPEFFSQLAVGGVDGTLRSRFRSHRRDRAIRAKTGTLRDAVSLCGTIQRPGRSPLAFAALIDGVDDPNQARSRVDAWVEALMRRP